jgi:hypothetical protein
MSWIKQLKQADKSTLRRREVVVKNLAHLQKRAPLMLGKMSLAVFLALGTIIARVHAGTSAGPADATMDFLEPKNLTTTIFPGPDSTNVLFTFRRQATLSNSTVRVLREYIRPDGTVTARERVRYESGQLVSCELEEPLTGARGRAVIQPDPKNPRERMVAFEYSAGENSSARTARETLRNDTLMNDMIGPYIETHWETLMEGRPVRFRFLALARRETVGFKLVKQSENTWRGKPVVILKMEPSSFIIGQLIDPLLFTVDKEPPHRVLQYLGRTTPRIQIGDSWRDVDALTIFDWPSSAGAVREEKKSSR